jgi:hypothetical protein
MQFDTYTLQARVLPGVLVALPLFVLISLVVVEPAFGIIPAVGGVAVSYACAELVRQRGVAVEGRLKQKWRGFPTTDSLRFNGRPASTDLLRRRSALESVSNRELPGRLQEDTDPDGAEEEIERAVKIGISRIRQVNVEAALLQRENVSYGFRRNLFALKGPGLTVLAVTSASTVYVLWSNPTALVLAMSASLTLFVGWITMVTEGWVLGQAKKYAERFFVAIETIAVGEPTPKE